MGDPGGVQDPDQGPTKLCMCFWSKASDLAFVLCKSDRKLILTHVPRPNFGVAPGGLQGLEGVGQMRYFVIPTKISYLELV